EEQEALRRMARDFLVRECPPALVRETATTPDGIPTALYAKMAELGWMGLIVPEAEGGLGLGVLELALVLEELGRVAAPGPFLGSQLVTVALLRAGTRTQRRTWMPRLVAGEAFGALAYLEESDRHDPPGITLRARRAHSRWRSSTARCASSSGGRSARSRRSSTWPPRWLPRSSRPAPSSGTRPTASIIVCARRRAPPRSRRPAWERSIVARWSAR